MECELPVKRKGISVFLTGDPLPIHMLLTFFFLRGRYFFTIGINFYKTQN